MKLGRVLACVCLAAGVLSASQASAWDSKGHTVIEALAYRTLVEGHGLQQPRPDVLRDLVNDGALKPPHCFGWDGKAPKDCVSAPKDNPLLCWPQPQTDRPDAAFRRQFSDPGQCFHFMATLDDAQTEPVEGTKVPRGLATTAVVRCRDLLDELLRQVVIDGGPGTRASGYGLYELAHAVQDAFSGAHVERNPATGEIEFLRVWQPIERLARLPTRRSELIPPDVYHVWDDHRDKAYVDDRVVGGRSCVALTDHPYDVPYECLSPLGDEARQALVELYILVRDLRVAQLLAPTAAPAPERSEAWVGFKAKWLTAAHACQGAECDARQPVETVNGGDVMLGLEGTWVPNGSASELAARGELFRFSEALNPFVYGIAGALGAGKEHGKNAFGFAGLELDLFLPVGKRAAISLTPVIVRASFGGEESGSEILTRLLGFQYQLGERTWLAINGPVQIDWQKSRSEWALGAAVAYALGSSKVSGGPLIRHHDDKVERRDETWVPPPAPYGRLLGRTASVFVTSALTPVTAPEDAVEGRRYGLGAVGADAIWVTDRWGGRFAWVPSVSFALGARATSGEATYLTGTLGAGLRWYALGPFGLSLTAIRVEGGPKVGGKDEVDPSPDVHGSGTGQYYLQAGSRFGIVFTAGLVDLLVEAPTLAWRSEPFNTGERVSFRLGIKLN